jgi:hypothetical protein
LGALKNIAFDSVLDRFDSNLWHFHIVVPKAVADKFLKQKVTRVVCSLNNSDGFHCAILSAGNGMHFININKKLRDALKLKAGSKVSAVISEDNSEYGLPMPEELEAALAQDDTGNDIFHALTPGKQRTLLYIVSTPKNVDLRIKRALVILEHLKQTKGKIDYKELNRMLKS